MAKRIKGDGRGRDAPDIQALEMMLDYAIMEGAELRLPLFVLFLRSARLELMTSIGAFGGLREHRVEAKIKDCLGASEGLSCAGPALPPPWIDAGGEASNDSTLLIHDR